MLTVGFGLLLALLTVTGVNAVFGLGGTAAQGPIRDWLSSAIYIVVAAIVALRAFRGPTRRGSWALFALGLSLYGVGNVLWSLWIGRLEHPPIPSICDGLWLTLYPLSYAGIIGFARVRGQRKIPAGVWLDGVIAGAGLAAVGAALVFHTVLAAATGSHVAVATELAYPIGDLLLAALVVGVLALRGWRIDRAWGLLGSGFLLLAIADCMYAVQVANGSSDPSPMTNFVYVLAVALLAFAAWQPEAAALRPRLERWSVLIVPAGFAVIALGLLEYDHVHRLDPLAYALVSVTLFAALLRIALTFRDVGTLAEARTQATTDELTSLPNRRLFTQRAADAIAAARLDGATLSLLMLDLDNFKALNDTLGHDAGDALLRLIGPRLRLAIRGMDTAARLGGDEFAILIEPQPEERSAGRVAERILRTLRDPFEIQGLAVRITASVGIASFPAHGDDIDELMKHADIAMYNAKNAHSGYELYARDLDTSSQAQLLLTGELATALEHDGVEVHFQPQADARSRQITGVEALVRLRLPGGRLVPPHEFLAVAEHGGMSRALTRKVLGLALDQIALWRKQGHQLTLAVNTTVADLVDTNFPNEVADALAARGLSPHVLVLEVTESSILSDPNRIGLVLEQLRELGIALSLDDFGTGYSALTHLKSLPVREVKIDRSFVAHMCNDTTDTVIVTAIIGLAHKLGIRIVAEGVEDETTWQALAALGCELIQGYFLSRPVPAAELQTRLNAAISRPVSGLSDAEIGVA